MLSMPRAFAYATHLTVSAPAQSRLGRRYRVTESPVGEICPRRPVSGRGAGRAGGQHSPDDRRVTTSAAAVRISWNSSGSGSFPAAPDRPLPGRDAEHQIAVEHGVHGVDGPGHPVVRDRGHLGAAALVSRALVATTASVVCWMSGLSPPSKANPGRSGRRYTTPVSAASRSAATADGRGPSTASRCRAPSRSPVPGSIGEPAALHTTSAATTMPLASVIDACPRPLFRLPATAPRAGADRADH